MLSFELENVEDRWRWWGISKNNTFFSTTMNNKVAFIFFRGHGLLRIFFSKQCIGRPSNTGTINEESRGFDTNDCSRDIFAADQKRFSSRDT